MRSRSSIVIAMLSALVLPSPARADTPSKRKCLALVATWVQSPLPVGYLANYLAPFTQTLHWESIANQAIERESTLPIEIDVASVRTNEVTWAVADDANMDIVNQFFKDDQVLVPKHPYNTDPSVPFYDRPATEKWPVQRTASRSLVIARSNGAFSVKAGTNFPHRTIEQTRKTRTVTEIECAIPRSNLINRVERKFGKDPDFIVLREILSVAQKNGYKGGYTVRDLTPLQDGHYYLPAFSIPFVGKMIARKHGKPFNTFWRQHYAEALGRAKAGLLLRYGLQMITPNTQNILIQLDTNLMPTGKIVIRDIGDSSLYEPVARVLGESDSLKTEIEQEREVLNYLNPKGLNSFWRLDEQDPMLAPTISIWVHMHEGAYVKEIQRLLGPSAPSMLGKRLNDWLQSSEGRDAIMNYHAKLKRQSQLRLN